MGFTLAAAILLAQADMETLVRKLGDDDLQVADEAENALIKRGTAALEPLRRKLEGAPAAAKERLKRVIERLEREVALEKAQGEPLRVTLKSDELPIAEALRKLSAAAGPAIVIEGKVDDRAALACERTPYWEAIESMCRGRNLVWEIDEPGDEPSRIVIRRGSARPTVIQRDVAFVLDDVVASGGRVQLRGFAAYARAAPHDAQLVFDEVAVEAGRPLQVSDGVFFGLETPPEKREARVGDRLRHAPFDMEGKPKTLARVRGAVVVRYALARKTVVRFGASKEACEKPVDEDGWRFTLWNCEGYKDNSIVFQLEAKGAAGAAAPWKPYDFVVVDADDRAHACGGKEPIADESTVYVLSAKLPAGATARSVELRAVSDAGEVRVPFDWKDVEITWP